MDLDRRDGACQGSATGDVRSTFTKRAPVDEEPEVASTGWKDHIVETVMSGSPVMVSADEPIANVADLLAGFEISGVPVVDDDNRLIGVISETDLVRVRGSTVAWPGWHGLLVSDLMTTPAKTIAASAPLAEAARVMTTERVHRLVVVDREQMPIGVISESDIVREIADDDDIGGSPGSGN